MASETPVCWPYLNDLTIEPNQLRGLLLTTLQADFDFGDNVDPATFEQILDMDEGEDEDSHEFSHSIVFGYFDQAETTFQKMDAAV